MGNNSYRTETPPGFCSYSECQKQLDPTQDKNARGEWHKSCKKCRDARKDAYRAKTETRSPQDLTLRTIRKVSIKRYIDALGLIQLQASRGSPIFASQYATELYDAITVLVHSTKLPTKTGEIHSLFHQPNFLDEEVQKLFLEYRHIWEDGPRRAATNTLSAEDTKDQLSIKSTLKCLIAKRAHSSLAKVQKSGLGKQWLGREKTSEKEAHPGSPSSSQKRSPRSPYTVELIDSDESSVKASDTEQYSNNAPGHLSEVDDNDTERSSKWRRIGTSSNRRSLATPSSFDEILNSHSNSPEPPNSLPHTSIAMQQGQYHLRELSTPKEWEIQNIACDELLEVLQSSNPQAATLHRLGHFEEILSGYGALTRMHEKLGIQFASAMKARQLWVDLHEEIRKFRVAAAYTGRARDEWQAYKQTLRSALWKEKYLPGVAAHRQLILFVDNLKRCGGWYETEDEFAQDLAIFYAALLQDPAFEADDLMGGFKEYNVELLAWFTS